MFVVWMLIFEGIYTFDRFIFGERC